MVKRMARCTTTNIDSKKMKTGRTTSPRKNNSLSKNQKNREGVKKAKQLPRETISSSSCSSESSCCYDQVNPVKGRRTPKRRVVKRKKERRTNPRNNLRTCYENPSYRGSNESVDLNSLDSQVSHIHVIESRSDNNCCTDSNQQYPTNSLSRDDKLTLTKIAEIDGLKLVKGHVDGSSTEISFQPALLMRVRKTPANLDVRPSNQASLGCSVSDGKAIPAEVRSPFREIRDCRNSNHSKVSVQNISRSNTALLGVKRSQNFTDINSQRKLQGIKTSKGTRFSSNKDVLEILPPQLMTNSSVDINVLRTSTTTSKNYNAFKEPDSTQTMCSRNTFPCIDHSFGSTFSHLQSSQISNTTRTISYDVQRSCSHDTDITQTAVQK